MWLASAYLNWFFRNLGMNWSVLNRLSIRLYKKCSDMLKYFWVSDTGRCFDMTTTFLNLCLIWELFLSFHSTSLFLEEDLTSFDLLSPINPVPTLVKKMMRTWYPWFVLLAVLNQAMMQSQRLKSTLKFKISIGVVKNLSLEVLVFQLIGPSHLTDTFERLQCLSWDY